MFSRIVCGKVNWTSSNRRKHTSKINYNCAIITSLLSLCNCVRTALGNDCEDNICSIYCEIIQLEPFTNNRQYRFPPYVLLCHRELKIPHSFQMCLCIKWWVTSLRWNDLISELQSTRGVFSPFWCHLTLNHVGFGWQSEEMYQHLLDSYLCNTTTSSTSNNNNNNSNTNSSNRSITRKLYYRSVHFSWSGLSQLPLPCGFDRVHDMQFWFNHSTI